MAKKRTPLATAPSELEYKPRLYLDLEGQNIDILKSLKVGSKGEFCVSGKICAIEQRERTDEKGKKRLTGSIQLEGYKVELEAEEENEYAGMSKEDD